MTAFELIYEVVRQIPRGMVTTYGTVAKLAGNPRWARAVGYALHANPEPYVETTGVGDDASGNSAEPNFGGFHAESANRVSVGGIPCCDDASGNSAEPNFGGFHAESANRVSVGGIPCHRVLNRFGEVCEGFAFGGADVQREMLEREGVVFRADGRVELSEYGWFV